MDAKKVTDHAHHEETLGDGNDIEKENAAEVTHLRSSSAWEEIKQNPRIISYCLLANSGSLAFGFDILVTTAVTALPAFSLTYGDRYNGELILPALWQGLWTAFIQLGIMIGAAASGVFQERFGRRISFILGGVTSSIGTAMAFTSPQVAELEGRRALFLCSKLLTGFGIGILMTTCQTYVSEISSLRLRGVLLGLFSFFTSVGQIIAVSLVFANVAVLDLSSFRTPIAVQWAFAAFAVFAALIIPESPMWYMTRENHSSAASSLKRLHGSSYDINAELERIRELLEQEKESQSSTGDATFANCFKGTDRRRTAIIMLVALLQYLLGVSLLANANYFLIMAGMSSSQSLQISQIGVAVQIIAVVVAWFTMTIFGRRTIVLWSILATALIFMSMGAAGFYQSDRTALRFIGVAIILVGSISQMGVGSAWPVLIGELSSIRLRAKSSAIGFITNALAGIVFSISVPYMFNVDAANLGGKVGLIFGALSFLSFGLCFFLVPETKELSYVQLDQLFEARTPARKFK